MNTTTIGVDLAKSVFQVSVANQVGRIVSRKRFSRSQFDRFLANHEPATLVMETCSSAHHGLPTCCHSPLSNFRNCSDKLSCRLLKRSLNSNNASNNSSASSLRSVNRIRSSSAS